MKNTRTALLMVGLLLSVVLVTLPVQATNVNRPTYAKGDFWVYRYSGFMSQPLDFNISVNRTSVKVSGQDCYELVAKTNSSIYDQTTTTWQRTDNLGVIKSYSTSDYKGMKVELTTTYKQGSSQKYRFPLKVGDKYSDLVEFTNNLKSTFNGITMQNNTTVKAKATLEVVSQESITVLAGTFDSLKMKMLTNISANITQFIWYSVKAGTTVKTLETDNNGTQNTQDDRTTTMELIRYKIQPQGGVNWGKTVSSKGEQTNFFIVVILIIVIAVVIVVLDITKAMKNRAGQGPGRYHSVPAQMGVGPARTPSQQVNYQNQYRARNRAPTQRYRDQPQDEYETYGNNR